MVHSCSVGAPLIFFVLQRYNDIKDYFYSIRLYSILFYSIGTEIAFCSLYIQILLSIMAVKRKYSHYKEPFLAL